MDENEFAMVCQIAAELYVNAVKIRDHLHMEGVCDEKLPTDLQMIDRAFNQATAFNREVLKRGVILNAVTTQTSN